MLAELLRGASGINVDIAPGADLLHHPNRSSGAQSNGNGNGNSSGSGSGNGSGNSAAAERAPSTASPALARQPRRVNSIEAVQMLAEMAVDAFLADDIVM